MFLNLCPLKVRLRAPLPTGSTQTSLRVQLTSAPHTLPQWQPTSHALPFLSQGSTSPASPRPVPCSLSLLDSASCHPSLGHLHYCVCLQPDYSAEPQVPTVSSSA
jgi:hypothetical protein